MPFNKLLKLYVLNPEQISIGLNRDNGNFSCIILQQKDKPDFKVKKFKFKIIIMLSV
jgi:hypothetical protein